MAECKADPSCEEYELPAVEAVLAGTLALMTGCAQAHCTNQRRHIMDRIVRNMALLAEHPQLSEPFRCAIGKLSGHWEMLLEDASPRAGDAVSRHLAPTALQ